MTYYRNKYIYKYVPINMTDDMIIKLHTPHKDFQMPRLINAALIQDVCPIYNENHEFVHSEVYTLGHTICVAETPDEIYDIIYKPRY